MYTAETIRSAVWQQQSSWTPHDPPSKMIMRYDSIWWYLLKIWWKKGKNYVKLQKTPAKKASTAVKFPQRQKPVWVRREVPSSPFKYHCLYPQFRETLLELWQRETLTFLIDLGKFGYKFYRLLLEYITASKCIWHILIFLTYISALPSYCAKLEYGANFQTISTEISLADTSAHIIYCCILVALRAKMHKRLVCTSKERTSSRKIISTDQNRDTTQSITVYSRRRHGSL